MYIYKYRYREIPYLKCALLTDPQVVGRRLIEKYFLIAGEKRHRPPGTITIYTYMYAHMYA